MHGVAWLVPVQDLRNPRVSVRQNAVNTGCQVTERHHIQRLRGRGCELAALWKVPAGLLPPQRPYGTRSTTRQAPETLTTREQGAIDRMETRYSDRVRIAHVMEPRRRDNLLRRPAPKRKRDPGCTSCNALHMSPSARQRHKTVSSNRPSTHHQIGIHHAQTTDPPSDTPSESCPRQHQRARSDQPRAAAIRSADVCHPNANPSRAGSPTSSTQENTNEEKRREMDLSRDEGSGVALRSRYARHPPKTEGRKPSQIERAKRLPVQISLLSQDPQTQPNVVAECLGHPRVRRPARLLEQVNERDQRATQAPLRLRPGASAMSAARSILEAGGFRHHPCP
jgi:hypothetical protein